jgi:hypothetical protein
MCIVYDVSLCYFGLSLASGKAEYHPGGGGGVTVAKPGSTK